MRQLNNDTIDEIMFGLLEGEITGNEKEHLLNAIQADPEYSALWKAWQQTILYPESHLQVMDISLLKKRARFVLPPYIRYAAAASLVIGFGIAILYNDKSPANIEKTALKPINGPVAGKKIPRIEKDSSSVGNYTRDTFVPLREKIKTIAQIKRIDKSFTIDSMPSVKTNFLPAIVPNNEQIKTAFSNQGNPLPAESVNNDYISVSVSYEKESAINKSPIKVNQPGQSFLSRIFGLPHIKIEKDQSTRSKKKIIIENNKYQIIAGF